MSESMKMYRIFNRRMISVVMLVDQMRRLAGNATLTEMADHVGLTGPDRSPDAMARLCERYSVPYRRENTFIRAARAKAVAMAKSGLAEQIRLARTEAVSAPLYRPGAAI